ncbi:MAG TPA: GNAT family N-acetyltransferase [Candidatus Limnocylindrales bacterium]
MTTTDTIAIAGLPPIPGLRVRPYLGPSDHPAMAAASNAWRASIGVTELVTVDALDNLYAHLTNSDPYRDCLALELDGEIVGYTRNEWETDDRTGDRAYDTTVILAPKVASEAGYCALLAEGARRFRYDHADRVGRPGDRFRAWIHDSDPRLVAAHVAAGFMPAHRWFELVRPTLDDLSEAPLPEGIEVRPVEPEHWRAVWEADIDAFSEDWDPADSTENAFQRFLGEPHQVPALWQVAWDGDQIAGHVLVTVNPEENERFGVQRGILDSVAVRKPWRRRGLARALIARTLVALREHGETSAGLGVDVDNPNQALTLYESCGFAVQISGTVFERPFA